MPFDIEEYMRACSHEILLDVMMSVTQALTIQLESSEPWLCPVTISTMLDGENVEGTMSTAKIPRSTLREAQRKDLVLGEVIEYVTSGRWPKVGNQKIGFPGKRKKLYLEDDGLLYRKILDNSWTYQKNIIVWCSRNSMRRWVILGWREYCISSETDFTGLVYRET